MITTIPETHRSDFYSLKVQTTLQGNNVVPVTQIHSNLAQNLDPNAYRHYVTPDSYGVSLSLRSVFKHFLWNVFKVRTGQSGVNFLQKIICPQTRKHHSEKISRSAIKQQARLKTGPSNLFPLMDFANFPSVSGKLSNQRKNLKEITEILLFSPNSHWWFTQSSQCGRYAKSNAKGRNSGN